MTEDLVISLKGPFFNGHNWWELLAVGTKALASVRGNVALGDEDGGGEALLKQIMTLK